MSTFLVKCRRSMYQKPPLVSEASRARLGYFIGPLEIRHQDWLRSSETLQTVRLRKGAVLSNVMHPSVCEFFSLNLSSLSIIDRADNNHFSTNMMCLSNALILNEARIVRCFRKTYVVPDRCSESQQECAQGNFILYASKHKKPLSICEC